MTKMMALELAKDNIPRQRRPPRGSSTPPMLRGVHRGTDEETQQKSLERYASVTPIGRHGETTDIANAVLYLASDEASFVTGHSLVVDGGFTAQ